MTSSVDKMAWIHYSLSFPSGYTTGNHRATLKRENKKADWLETTEKLLFQGLESRGVPFGEVLSASQMVPAGISKRPGGTGKLSR